MKVNSVLTEQGSWVDNIPDLPGIRMKARGANNSEYLVLAAKLIRDMPWAGRLERLKPAAQQNQGNNSRDPAVRSPGPRTRT